MPTKPVIAIADDDDSVCEALSALIRSMGCVAVPFSRAEELLGYNRRRSVSCGKH